MTLQRGLTSKRDLNFYFHRFAYISVSVHYCVYIFLIKPSEHALCGRNVFLQFNQSLDKDVQGVSEEVKGHNLV